MSELTLLLRKNQFSSRWRLDYNVVERQPDGTECVVGRMYSGAGSTGDKWVWAIEGVGSWRADSQELALAAFKKRWLAQSKEPVVPI